MTEETDIADEFRWIYGTLQARPTEYLLEAIVDAGKTYSASDVHAWGVRDEWRGVYEKVRDLIKVRTFEAVKRGELDKVLAGEILKTYYYAPFKEGDDKPEVRELSDGDVAILRAAGVYVE